MPYFKDPVTGKQVYASVVEGHVILKENAIEKAHEQKSPQAWKKAIEEQNHKAAEKSRIEKMGEHVREQESPEQRFSRNVVSLCKMKNLYIGDIQKNAGISKGNISRVRSGVCSISLNCAINIAGQLGTPIQDMVTKDFFVEARKAELLAMIEQLKNEMEQLQ